MTKTMKKSIGLVLALVTMIALFCFRAPAFAGNGGGTTPIGDQKVITGIRAVISSNEEIPNYYPILGKKLTDSSLSWEKFNIYTDKNSKGEGIADIIEVVPDTAEWVDFYYEGNKKPLKFDKDTTIIWPLEAENHFDDSQNMLRYMKLRIKDEYKDKYRFPRKGEGALSVFVQEPAEIFDFDKFVESSIMRQVLSDAEMLFVTKPFVARHYVFTGDKGVKEVGLKDHYSRMGWLSKDTTWGHLQREIDFVTEKIGKDFYTLKDGYDFAGIYDKDNKRVDNQKPYDVMVAGLNAQDKEGSAIGRYQIKTVPKIIPFEPTDPKKPADSNDPNIDKAFKEVEKDHPIDRADYAIIAFNTNGHGNLDGKEALAYLVKKGTKFKKIPLPEAKADKGYKFSSVMPALDEPDTKVMKDKVFTVKFAKEARAMNTAPVLKVRNKTITKGEKLDLMSLVKSAKDAEDGDLMDKVVILDDGGFDANKLGRYIITFKVSDKDGASMTKKASVIVAEKATSGDMKDNKIKTADRTNIYGSLFIIITIAGLAIVKKIKEAR